MAVNYDKRGSHPICCIFIPCYSLSSMHVTCASYCKLWENKQLLALSWLLLWLVVICCNGAMNRYQVWNKSVKCHKSLLDIYVLLFLVDTTLVFLPWIEVKLNQLPNTNVMYFYINKTPLIRPKEAHFVHNASLCMAQGDKWNSIVLGNTRDL